MKFELFPWRFTFIARDSIHFPPLKSGNILRGAFGSIFRNLACLPECTSVLGCHLRKTCAYARIFEPSSAGYGPSGLEHWPRPFVFRAAHLDNQTIAPNQLFFFDLHVFMTEDPPFSHFVSAFERLAEDGVGPHRGRAELESVWQLDAGRSPMMELYRRGIFQNPSTLQALEQPLTSDSSAVSRLIVRFLTPCELKTEQGIATTPEFPVLFSRARDRVSTLRALYGAGAADIDFQGVGARAKAVNMTRCDMKQVVANRRSTRTGQTHPLGGFVGEAEYEGDITEFLPFLRAAEWTGVGRQTVWGKGEIRCEVP
jgi:hypothetical protein